VLDVLGRRDLVVGKVTSYLLPFSAKTFTDAGTRQHRATSALQAWSDAAPRFGFDQACHSSYVVEVRGLGKRDELCCQIRMTAKTKWKSWHLAVEGLVCPEPINYMDISRTHDFDHFFSDPCLRVLSLQLCSRKKFAKPRSGGEPSRRGSYAALKVHEVEEHVTIERE
jgi:hypothetical protein